jgi:hypothetical protein
MVAQSPAAGGLGSHRTTHVHGRPFLHRRRSLGPPRWMPLANRHCQVPGWEPPMDVTMFCGRNANERDGYRAPPVIGWRSRIRRTPGHLTVPVRRVCCRIEELVWYAGGLGWGMPLEVCPDQATAPRRSIALCGPGGFRFESAPVVLIAKGSLLETSRGVPRTRGVPRPARIPSVPPTG